MFICANKFLIKSLLAYMLIYIEKAENIFSAIEFQKLKNYL